MNVRIGTILFSLSISIAPLAADAATRAQCVAACGAQLTACAQTARPHHCRKALIRTCRQDGVSVCQPLPNPACGPQCPGGGPAVWTGTASPSTGGTLNIVASMCLQPPYTIVGNWSCSAGTAPCITAGGPLLGSLVGANLTAHSAIAIGFTDPIWTCDFVATKTGETLAGNWSCTGYAGMFSGTWQLQRCQ